MAAEVTHMYSGKVPGAKYLVLPRSTWHSTRGTESQTEACGARGLPRVRQKRDTNLLCQVSRVRDCVSCCFLCTLALLVDVSVCG